MYINHIESDIGTGCGMANIGKIAALRIKTNLDRNNLDYIENDINIISDELQRLAEVDPTIVITKNFIGVTLACLKHKLSDKFGEPKNEKMAHISSR